MIIGGKSAVRRPLAGSTRPVGSTSRRPKDDERRRAQRRAGSGTKSILDCYFASIRKFPSLSREDEARLAAEAQAGRVESLNRLVECNLQFVVRVATDYRNCGLPLEDLINEGNLGLIEAARRFDPNRGLKFISWAIWWIRKSIRIALAEQRVVRLPASQVKKMRIVRETERSLAEALGRTPTDDELAAELPDDLSRMDPIHRHGLRLSSLDEPVTAGRSETFANWLEDGGKSAELGMIDEEATSSVVSMYHELNDQQRIVITGRFGLDGDKPQTLESIGQRIGLSRERVRQIESKAIKNLRKRFLACG